MEGREKNERRGREERRKKEVRGREKERNNLNEKKEKERRKTKQRSKLKDKRKLYSKGGRSFFGVGMHYLKGPLFVYTPDSETFRQFRHPYRSRKRQWSPNHPSMIQ